MFNMSPLQWYIGITTALFVTLVVYEIGIRWYDRYRIKNGIEEDRSKDNTFNVKYHKIPRSNFRILFEGILIIITGVMMLLSYFKMTEYQKYGAFYDTSWRAKEVEDHFIFTTEDTEFLQDIYNADPENFDYAKYAICLVRIGCADCEKVQDVIKELDNENLYIIHSRSDIGKRYVERYGVQYVPSVIVDDTVIPLYSSESYQPQNTTSDTGTDNIVNDVEDMADDLIENNTIE